MALLSSGRRVEAAAAFARLSNEHPSVERFATTAAVLSLETQGPAMAEPRLRRAVERFPGSATAWGALGNALSALGALPAAVEALERATSLAPTDARLWFSRGRAHQLMGHAAAADEAFARALALDPSHRAALAGRAAAANWCGAWARGEAMARAALALGPDPDAQLNLGIALLAQGRWAEGWDAYEARWEVAAASGARRAWPGRRWTGVRGTGETIVAVAEQGLGDTIQFARWAPALRAYGFRVVLAVQPSLVRLLAAAGLADAVVRLDDLPEEAAWHVPLLSLPRYLPMVAGQAYLLRPVVARAAQTPPRIGLVWAGSATHANDARRSMTVDDLAPLLAIPGVTWQSLQHGPRGDDAVARQVPITPLPSVRDMADTAEVVASCDMVIAVDTAVAHLAAAMGVATWILVPAAGRDWRWATATSGRTAWYDAARVIAQPSEGPWVRTVTVLASSLREALSFGGAR